MEEWVEVEGKTVDVALQAALEALGLSSAEEAEVEILEEPQKGFLGLGSKAALIRVKPRPKKRRRRRRRSRSGGGGEAAQKQGGGRERAKPAKKDTRSESKPEAPQRGGDQAKAPRPSRQPQPKAKPKQPTEDQMDVETQAEIVGGFLKGLLDAFGLEGDVETRIEDGVIYAEVLGEQTEALVGPKGSILQAIQELTRTVVQRQSRDSARIRLDIAGYAERRRSALKIYTARLAEQVLESGREAVLEPMNPSDRKVVHDVIAEIDGVRSYSEGEEPNRSVVVGLAPGYEPPQAEQEEPASAESEDEPEAPEAEGAGESPPRPDVDVEGEGETGADGDAAASQVGDD